MLCYHIISELECVAETIMTAALCVVQNFGPIFRCFYGPK